MLYDHVTQFDTYLDGVMFMSIPTADERMPRRKDHINDEDDNYINFFTVGPIEDDAKKVTGKFKTFV